MKLAFWQRLAVLTVLGLGTSSFSPVLAAQFEQQEIDQSRFIVVAAPGGDIGYKLLIIEQLNNKRPCWSETGGNPSSVDPLLLSFDFTGICNRLVDSNSFSVRTAGEDQGLQYSLRVLRRDNDLVLVAASNTDRNVQIEIGRTYGLPNGFSRIVLDPGWRLTRRTYNGRALGHVYLTYDQPMEVLAANARNTRNNGSLNGSFSAPVTTPPPDANTLPDATNSPSPADPTLPPGSSDGTVIPVPALPPAVLNTPASPPPDQTTAPAPAILPPRSGGAPNLSTILPRPSTSTQTNPRAEAAPDSGLLLPPPPPVLPLDESAGSTSQSSSQTPSSTAGDNASATSGSAAPSSPSSGTQPPANADRAANQASGSSASRSSSDVPQASNSGGAALRPRSLRRNAPSASSTSVSRAASTSSPTQPRNQPDQASTASNSDAAQGQTYQVVVVADSAETQDKVRAIAPNAFLTTINGQVVMQVGIFRSRQQADQLQQRFSQEGLPTAVIPVR